MEFKSLGPLYPNPNTEVLFYDSKKNFFEIGYILALYDDEEVTETKILVGRAYRSRNGKVIKPTHYAILHPPCKKELEE